MILPALVFPAQTILQIKTKIVSYHTADPEPVKQEVDSTVILPPFVFPAQTILQIKQKLSVIIQLIQSSQTGTNVIKLFMVVSYDFL